MQNTQNTVITVTNVHNTLKNIRYQCKNSKNQHDQDYKTTPIYVGIRSLKYSRIAAVPFINMAALGTRNGFPSSSNVLSKREK